MPMSAYTLMPTTTIPVIGMPSNVNVGTAIRNAEFVAIVTAFAHQSGWERIRKPLLDSGCDVTLIAGLDFCHTEPRVLRDWIGKEFTNRSARSAVYSRPG